MIRLWHTLRRTRLVALLTHQNELRAQQVRLLTHQNELLEQRIEAMATMLDTSRAEHGKALQRISELEATLAEHHDREEWAAREWLSRFRAITVSAN